MSRIRELVDRFICFELIFVFLFIVVLLTTSITLLSDISVADDNDKKVKDNINNADFFIRRALLFDRFFVDSDWASYGKLMKDPTQKEDSINLVIEVWHHIPDPNQPINDKEIIPYLVLFGSQLYDEDEKDYNDEEFISEYTLRPLIMMSFRNDDKKEITSFVEFSATYNVEILFYKNAHPQKFLYRIYDIEKGGNFDNPTEINWDENGKITLSEKIEQLQKLQKLPDLLSDLPKKTNKPRQSATINLPAIKDQKILQMLKRTEKINNSKNLNELLECSKELPLFDKKKDTPSIYVRLVNNNLKHILIMRKSDGYNDDKLSYDGYFLSFKDNRLLIYAEGDISMAFNRYYDVTAKDNTKLDNLSINGKGTEIKFHSTGFPSTYKSIVKNRLYGHQIEWNDKGEIISDIDLDIPKEWKDAPKKSDKSIKK
jgi:hypothetical protein